MFADSGMKRLLGAQFYVCGAEDLPGEITVNGGRYSFIREFKNNFFTAAARAFLIDVQPWF
jgi:hypothetical protein